MSVLVEAISVIIRLSTIQEKYPGGWEGFKADLPNDSLCSDGEVARVGFMAVEDVDAFTSALEKKGLIFIQDGKSIEIAVVDQLHGPTRKCDWLEHGFYPEPDGGRTRACRLHGSQNMLFFSPEGWEYQNSLSQNCNFVYSGSVSSVFKFQYKKDGVEYYLNRLTGKIECIGRTDNSPLDHLIDGS